MKIQIKNYDNKHARFSIKQQSQKNSEQTLILALKTFVSRKRVLTPPSKTHAKVFYLFYLFIAHGKRQK